MLCMPNTAHSQVFIFDCSAWSHKPAAATLWINTHATGTPSFFNRANHKHLYTLGKINWYDVYRPSRSNESRESRTAYERGAMIMNRFVIFTGQGAI
jgi:hypothetical protein